MMITIFTENIGVGLRDTVPTIYMSLSTDTWGQQYRWIEGYGWFKKNRPGLSLQPDKWRLIEVRP